MDISSDSTTNGRKRALSIGDHAPNKAIKLAHSPVPAAGGRVKVGASSDNPGQNYPKPVLSMPGLAATILYGALRPFDHWPAPLVKVYCDDCFAGRKWVDMKECQPLVLNLSLIHAAPGDDNDDDIECPPYLADEASRVAVAYRHFFENGDEKGMTSRQAGVDLTHRRDSMSSTDSTSLRHVPSDPQRIEDDGDVCSSSGEEEDEDGEVEGLPQRENPQLIKGAHYPIHQRRPNLVAVRQRYFGSNRVSAHNRLVISLSERLESKSKQSSNLLTTLQTFVRIPRVRQLAAENLERWLQSPAVSGNSSSVTNLQQR